MAKSKSTTAYVVMAESYEYNDEWFYKGEYQGGEAVKAFKTKAKADAEAKVLNEKQYLEHAPDEYLGEEGYGEDAEEELCKLHPLISTLRDPGKEREYWDNGFNMNSIWDELPNDVRVKIWERVLPGYFYYVSEVELE